MTIRVEGKEEALEVIVLAQEKLKPGNAFTRVITWGLETLRRYAVSITPRKTGRLAAGHTISVHGLEGNVVNPVPYAMAVHAMGGRRAFYDRTMSERGPAVLSEMTRMLGEEIF